MFGTLTQNWSSLEPWLGIAAVAGVPCIVIVQGVFGVPEARLYWMPDLGIFKKGTRLGESDRVLE